MPGYGAEPFLENILPIAQSRNAVAGTTISFDILDNTTTVIKPGMEITIEGVLAYSGNTDLFYYPFNGPLSSISVLNRSYGDGFRIVIDSIPQNKDFISISIKAYDTASNVLNTAYSFLVGDEINTLYYSDGYGLKKIHISEIAGESQEKSCTFLTTSTYPSLPTNTITNINSVVIGGYLYLTLTFSGSNGVCILKDEVTNKNHYVSTSSVKHGYLSSTGILYFINTDLNRIEVYYGADYRSPIRSPDFVYDASSTPSVFSGRINSLKVSDGKSQVADDSARLYIGTEYGLTRIDTYESQSVDGYSDGYDGYGLSFSYGISTSSATYKIIGGTIENVTYVDSDDDNNLFMVATDDGYGNGGITQITLAGNRRLIFMSQSNGLLPSGYINGIFIKKN